MKEVSNDDFILRLHLTAWETTAVQHSGAAIVNRSAKKNQSKWLAHDDRCEFGSPRHAKLANGRRHEAPHDDR